MQKTLDTTVIQNISTMLFRQHSTLKRLLTLLIGIFCFQVAQAAHIVGGDITYEHVSGDDYRINLRIYRDIGTNPNQTDFDEIIYLYIYEENTSGVFDFYDIESINLIEENITALESIVDPCIIGAPALNFEVVTYSKVISLPNTPQFGYHIGSQRCCRNGTIANIQQPDNTGIVWYVHVNKNALDNNHSAPNFEQFEELFICKDYESEIDFSVSTNAPNTTVTYAPITPYAEGFNGDDCDIFFNPDDADCDIDVLIANMTPPYNNILWEVDQNGTLIYDMDNQFGNDQHPFPSQFDVDPITGMVTINPSTLGLFLVGIQAIEIDTITRDTLSIVYKEYEIKVENCQITTANFEVDPSLCDTTLVQVSDESTLHNSIIFYPDMDQLPGVFYEFDAGTGPHDIDYGSYGTFNSTLIALGNICNDTITLPVTVYEDLIPELFDSLFQTEYLLCFGGTIELNPDSIPVIIDPVYNQLEFSWEYGDTTYTGINPTITAISDGEVYLTISNFGPFCEDHVYQDTVTINLLEIDDSIQDIQICYGDSLELVPTFNNNTIVQVDWLPDDYNITINGETAIAYPTTDTSYTATITFDWVFDDDDPSNDGYNFNCPVDSIEIIYNIEVFDLEINILASDTANCAEAGVWLIADPLVDTISYDWYDPEFLSSDDSISVNPSTLTTYTLIGTSDVLGCMDTAQIDIYVPNDSFFFEITTDPTIFCFNDISLVTVNTSTNIPGPITWEVNGVIQADTSGSIEVNPADNLIVVATIIDDLGCVYTDSTTFISSEPFEVSLSGEDINCLTDNLPVQLTATITPALTNPTIIWSENGVVNNDLVGTIIQVDPTSTITYSVLVIDEFGCEEEASFVVTVPDELILTIEGNSIYCFNETDPILLEASPSVGITFEWSDSSGTIPGNGSTISVSPDVSEIYSVIGTDEFGCMDSTTFEVVVPDPFAISIVGPTVNCLTDEDPIELEALVDPDSVQINWEWFENGDPYTSGTNTISVNPIEGTEYTVIGENWAGCTDTSEVFTVITPEPFEVLILGEDTICPPVLDSIELSYSTTPSISVDSIVWEGSDGSIYINQETIFVLPGTGITTYTLTVFDVFGCFASTTHTITLPEENIFLIDAPQINCLFDGDSITISATSSVQPLDITWIDENGNTWNGPVIQVDPTETTTYYVTGIDAYGCISEDSVTILVPDIPNFSVDNQINCLTDLDPVILTIDNPDNLNIQITWTPNEGTINGNEITVDPQTTTTYDITIIDLDTGCPYFLSAEVFVPELITVEISGDNLICLDEIQEITLTADAPLADTIIWIEAGNSDVLSNEPTLIVTPTETTTYVVEVIDAFGCIALDSFEVVITDPIEVTTVFIGSEINCLTDQDSVTLVGMHNLMPADSTQWAILGQDPFITNTDTINVYPSESTSYVYTVFDSNGCDASDTINVIVPETEIIVTGIGDDLIKCINEDESVLLTAFSNVPNTIFDWYILGEIDPIETDTSQISVAPDSTTQYVVIGTDEYGCESSDTITVVVPELLIDFDLEGDLIHCFNQEDSSIISVINANVSPITYTWYENDEEIPNETGPQLDIDPTVTSIYTAIGIDTFGCRDTNYFEIMVPDTIDFNLPSFNTCADSAEVCIDINSEFALIDSINWLLLPDLVLADVFNDTCTIIPLPNISNDYAVTVVDTFGCAVTETASITNGNLNLTANDYFICPGAEVLVELINNDPSDTITVIQWNVDDIITVIQEGDLDILVYIDAVDTTAGITPIFENQFGCVDSLDIMITTSDFNPESLEDIFICYDTLICLNPNFNPSYDYTWTMNDTFFTNDPNPCVNLTESTTFTVIITDNTSNTLGCTTSDTMQVFVNEPLNSDLISDPISDTLCYYPDSIALEVTNSSTLQTVDWFINGVELPAYEDDFNISVGNPGYGTYTYTAFISNDTIIGCFDSLNVTFDIYPIDAALDDTLFCYEPESSITLTLDSLYDIDEINWFHDGSNGESITVSPTNTTTYEVEVSNSYGCIDTLAGTVEVFNFVDGFTLTADPDTIREYSDVEIDLTLFLTNQDQVGEIIWSEDPDFATLFELYGYSNIAQYLQETTTYYATITGPDGECPYTDSVVVTVLPTACDTPYIFIPNSFTPNGDGVNDELKVYGNQIDFMEFYVVNRWGQTVFESNDPDIGWNGTFLNEALPPDVYGYTLKAICKDQEIFISHGNINLLK